jgi:hypothetical protein
MEYSVETLSKKQICPYIYDEMMRYMIVPVLVGDTSVGGYRK